MNDGAIITLAIRPLTSSISQKQSRTAGHKSSRVYYRAIFPRNARGPARDARPSLEVFDFPLLISKLFSMQEMRAIRASYGASKQTIGGIGDILSSSGRATMKRLAETF